MTKRMPPAQVDPTIGKFINKHAITDKALRTLVHWIDAGSPIAPADKNENDPLTATTAQPQSEWLLGEPDLEISISSNAIPAKGVIDYINELIEVNFEQEKWVKAVQFLPGDRSVLHHLQVRIQPNLPNETELSPREIARQRRFLEGYAPGKEGAMIFPENTGVVIRPGDKLFFTMHYTANGKATVDASRMALYFYDKAPEHEYTTINSGNYNFTIPPQVRHFPMEFKHTLKKDIVLYAMRPHMHFRGRAMQFVVTYPNQQQETLLSVPNYSYAWQPSYKLESPTPIPAGSTISIQGHFDNSQHNLANPDPNIAVGYGLQSWDEMFIGYLSYREQ